MKTFDPKGKSFTVGWWSAGVTSAVACKIALELYENVELFYIDVQTHHPDNTRFMMDCEEWYGKEIHTIKNEKYANQFDVIEDLGVVNTPYGAPCTTQLKKNVRYELEGKFAINLFNTAKILGQVWGFEFDYRQVNRAIRFGQQYPHTNPLFPLIEKGLSKNECAGILANAGIELPKMYRMGYTNNNCIGCVKGGMGYWNQIRRDFPETFDRMAKLERKIDRSCINGVFLDELEPARGHIPQEIIPECGIVCAVEFEDLPDACLGDVLEGTKNIYQAIAESL